MLRHKYAYSASSVAIGFHVRLLWNNKMIEMINSAAEIVRRCHESENSIGLNHRSHALLSCDAMFGLCSKAKIPASLPEFTHLNDVIFTMRFHMLIAW